ncbi:hypothetical protein [Maritalea porphyrae]|nr:hypothetical protein [Maritalea porphyrae]
MTRDEMPFGFAADHFKLQLLEQGHACEEVTRNAINCTALTNGTI